MSVREVLSRSIQRGIQVFRTVARGEVRERPDLIRSGPAYDGTPRLILGSVFRSSFVKKSADIIGSFGNVWKSGLKDTFAAYLRRRTGWRFLNNGRQAGPLLGLVGLTMVSTSGPGLITNHEELKAICEQIRISMGCLSTEQSEPDLSQKKSLTDYTIGSVIAKGCNAVVYSVKENKSKPLFDASEITGESIFVKNNKDAGQEDVQGHFAEYPLALKMMFNYDAESNAPVIFRAMYRETLPTTCLMLTHDPLSIWEADRFLKALPFHPNIVDMKCAFADRVPSLPDQHQLYPHALPTRLYPDGCGRNMTLFLVMKRYHKSLKEFLEMYKPSTKVSVILLSQLLEGVQHLNKNGIAHRDLKSDNILLDLSAGPDIPHLVITDFGCCSVSLSVPFPSLHFDQREGNVAMMAPEVACAIPSAFMSIDYSKADLWTVGALTYEIFGMRNPFYRTEIGNEIVSRLDSRTYTELDLPEMSVNVPIVIKKLVKNLLRRDPAKRMEIGVAANICHLLQIAPRHWLVQMGKPPTEDTVTKWLVLQAASCVYHLQRHLITDTMKMLFLRRVKIEEVYSAMRFIRSCS